MNKEASFWKRHKEALAFLYFPVYLFWFFRLEQMSPENIYIVTNPLDSLVPFCEYFIVPYLMWFPYLFGFLAYFYVADRKKNFINLAVSLIIGLTVCLIVYTFFPNAQALRLEEYPNRNLFTQIVMLLQGFDTPTNVCPSIHVFSTVVVHVMVQKSSCHRWVKAGSLVTAVLICLSTVFLKQHSVTDVIWGMVLAVPVCGLVFVMRRRRRHKGM